MGTLRSGVLLHCAGSSSTPDNLLWSIPCSPEGTYASAATYSTTAAKGCSKCPSGWFRTGDASLNNNECKKIPAGGRSLKTVGDLEWQHWQAVPSLPSTILLRTSLLRLGFQLHPRLRHSCLPCSGYKGISFKDDSGKTGAYAIEACAAGSVSYWVKDDTKFGKEARVPADAPHECKLCSSDNGGSGKSNTYAPRTGVPL